MRTVNAVNALSAVDLVVAAGSVDGILTTAAVVRNAQPMLDVFFSQAFQVDKLDPSQWTKASKVLLINLAVDSRDPEKTKQFIKRILDAGHKLVGVLDEHGSSAWKQVLGSRWDTLQIKPVSQDTGAIKSSGALLLNLLGERADPHTEQLCLAADAADQMDFSSHFAGIASKAVKSKIQDDTRRVHLAQHLAFSDVPDATIRRWISEYDTILANHKTIINEAESLDGGRFIRASMVGKTVDMTVLMSQLYKLGEVVILEGEFFEKKLDRKVTKLAFGMPQGSGDLVSVLRNAGIPADGFAEKANVLPEHSATAIAAVGDWLRRR